MGLRNFRNGQATSLAVPVDATSTNIQVASASSFPTSFPYTLIVDPDGILEEAVDVTAAVGTSLTVVRGADGTTASPHSAGVTIYHGVTARDHAESNAHVNATSNVHGRTGALLDTASAQTIAGAKTFTGGLATAAGPVVAVAGDQSIGGIKTFDTLRTNVGGDVVAVNGAQTIAGNKTYSGNNVYNGTEDHNGTQTIDGATTYNAPATFNDVVAVGGANLTGPWNTYSPIRRDGAGGTQLATGADGSLTGRYKIIGGKTCLFEILFVFGTASHLGTTGWTFSLPFASLGFRWGGTAFLVDASAGKEFMKAWRTIGGQEIVVVAEDGNRISNAGPLVWAVGDEVFMSGSYELP